jgi:hypothetical protein
MRINKMKELALSIVSKTYLMKLFSQNEKI